MKSFYSSPGVTASELRRDEALLLHPLLATPTKSFCLFDSLTDFMHSRVLFPPRSLFIGQAAGQEQDGRFLKEICVENLWRRRGRAFTSVLCFICSLHPPASPLKPWEPRDSAASSRCSTYWVKLCLMSRIPAGDSYRKCMKNGQNVIMWAGLPTLFLFF